MDIKTVLISYLITNAICAGVIWVLYSQNRKHFNGLEFWLTAYLMQFAGLALIIMRGTLPEFISVVVGNGIFIGGTAVLYMGLERFLGKRSNQIHNLILWVLFVAAHAYFLAINPSMTARSLNLSLALVALCAQFVWLIFRRVDVNLRPVVREAGFLFAAYGIVSLIRICLNLVTPLGEDLFQLDLFNTIVVLTYQMLFIALTFSLFMMVNRRLALNLHEDITERKQAESQWEAALEKLRESEERLRLAVSAGSMGIWDRNFVTGLLNWSVECKAMFGLPPETEMNDERFMNILHPDDRLPIDIAIREAQAKQTDFNTEYRVIWPDGTLHWIAALGHWYYDEAGQAIRMSGTTLDITERKRMEDELRKSGEQYRFLLNNTSDFIVHFDRNGIIRFGTDASLHFNGYELTEIINTSGFDRIHPEDQDKARKKLRDTIEIGDEERVEYRLKRKSGGYMWVEAVGRRVFNTLGEPEVIVVQRDITKRKRAEEELIKAKDEAEESEARFRKSLEFSPTPIAVADNTGKLIFLNKKFVDTYGYTLQDIQTIDQWMLQAYPNTDYRNLILQQWGQDVENAINNNTPTPLRAYQATCKSGEVKTVEITAYFEKELVIGHFQDITERVRAENELHITHKTLQTQFNEINMLKETLQEQAIRDPLTNLHNRRYLNETLGHEVARAKRENYPIGVMLIDIDRFKKFNDTYGHSTGDEVLKSLSRLLVDSVRQGDIACRYGGEEFLVVMIGAHETDVKRRAEAICHDFSRLRINFEGQELFATVSVGIAFYPKHGVDIQQVISAADGAMYQAKEAGQNRVQAWEAGA